MYVYTWPGGLSASKGDKVPVSQYFECPTQDKGIDKFTSKNDVILAFTDCIQKADKKIPYDRKGRAYLSLAGTAGMRLLK